VKQKPRPWFTLIRTVLTLEERKRFRKIAELEYRTMSGLATYLIREYIAKKEAEYEQRTHQV